MNHENVRTWRWLVWLLAPAVPLHEFTHAIVASWQGASVTIDWAVPSAEMDWPDHPVALGVLVAHVAPFLLGYLLGVAALVAFALGASVDVSLGAGLWLATNWLYYSFPTKRDLSVLPIVANSVLGRRH